MDNQLITAIEQEMLGTLDNAQLEKLHEVLTRRLYGITTAATADESGDNAKLLSNFIAAKRVEGCSDKSLRYYESTLRNMLAAAEKSGFYKIIGQFYKAFIGLFRVIERPQYLGQAALLLHWRQINFKSA